ncbi:protein mono-ADP-ribosyltransferase PARP14-like isoform X1 [Thalassophryne amazonica]|uniref:protein mono-ADP-ribosyltransferase PARP14-like isoform X1 n=1 Tax=Thalassophryne amazonica TaxID=390379 RepID=UPI0014726BBF|nr:protein mono-ADP-ribosyltransferase PARP14-like isoform X1 [Thalassophryne amazonica]
MEGTYSYVLLVELHENNIPRLKNKLVKYFQSKKSNGGDCEVDYENGRRTAVLRFRSEKDRQKVLAKETHEIIVDKDVLKMTVRLPEEEKSTQGTPSDGVNKKSDVAENKKSASSGCTPAAIPQTEKDNQGDQTAEELHSTSAVLGNVTSTVSQEFLEMLVENILKDPDSPTPSRAFSLEVIPGLSSAVVTFQSIQETTDFIQRCPSNRTFKNKKLSVRLLEVTNEVLMEGTQNYNADFLHLYFENAGGNVENIVVNEEEQSAVITFNDHKAVQRTLKKKHHIQQQAVSIYPFYKSLGTALYGKDRAPLELPNPISEHIDKVIARYLQVSPLEVEAIRSDLAKHFCSVAVQQSTVCMSPMSSLLQQKDVKALIKNWTKTVKSTLEQSLSKFKCLKFNIEEGAWDEAESKINQVLLNEKVVVVPVKAHSILYVGGSDTTLNRVEQTLHDIVNNIFKRLQREKMCITRKIKVSPSTYYLMSQDDFQDSLQLIHREFKMSYNKDGHDFIMTGLSEEILAATEFIYNAKLSLKQQKLEMDDFVLEFLKDEKQEDLTHALLTSRQVHAAFEINTQGIQLIALNDRELKNAQHHLTSLLVSQYIDVQDCNVLKKPEWQQLVSHLEKVNNESYRKISIQTKDQQVVVAGYKDCVETVSSKLDDFLQQNAEVEETVPLKHHIIVEYIEKHVALWKDQVKDKAVVSFKKEVICLSGSKVNVANCQTLFQDLAATLHFEVLKVNKPGVKMLFQDKEAMIVSSITNVTGCLVQLIDESSGSGQGENSQQTYSTQVNINIDHPQSPQAAKSPTVKPAADPSCLGQFLTKEGLAIALMTGDIANATTAVTVNSISADLDLNKGNVSKAIIRVAGPKLQELINEKTTSGNVGEVIVTDGCKLRSKQVFHAIAPDWDNGQGSAEKTLSDLVWDCLNKAEDSGLNSITFPAIGTGNLGFPKDLAAAVMFDQISAFSSKKQPKHLKTVVIVLYHGDASTIQAACDEFSKCFPTESDKPVSTHAGFFSEITSRSGLHECKMGNVTIQLVTGDITKETTDVIVNSSNDKFNLKSGVSKAILDAAGQAVEAECQVLGAQGSDSMIITHPGSLKCKNILHVVGQADPIKIQNVVKKVIQRCLKDSYTSVSLPAIGTGQGKVEARHVADAMLDAVVAVLSKNPGSPLKMIRIVIFQQTMLKDFYKSMQRREASDQQQKGSSFWGNIGSKFKSLFTAADTQPQKGGDFVIEPLKVDPTCFHICGRSQATVNSAKQCLNDFICKEQDNTCIKDNIILSFTTADHQRLVDMQKTMAVSIRVECKMSQASVSVVGLRKDVLKANNEIYDMLRKARNEEELKNKVDLACAKVDWQYQQQGKPFKSFDSMANFQLEEAWEKKHPNVQVVIEGQKCTVTMPSGPAKDSQGGAMKIRRIDKSKDQLHLPQHWDAMPNDKLCHTVTIQAKTAEHDDILNLFQTSCKRTVLKIERIQNATLWKSLEIKKSEMDLRNGHQNNEKHLFHGTCPTTIAHINQHGFNRSYAGRNAACYGNGTYFAVDASYSARDTYSMPDSQGQKYMYLCRVLTGDFTDGQQNMIVPPDKPSGSLQRYDSVVDNTAKPSMFVIFHDTQAYPEYLITFK